METNQTKDTHHQKTDIDETDLQHDGAIVNQANLIIREWQDCSEEILKRYQDSLGLIHTETGSLADEFDFLSYPSIHKNLKLPGELRIVDGSDRVTVAIQFQKKPRNVLRLYLCQIGETDGPKSIYAALHYQFGRQIALMSEDPDCDAQAAKLRFNEWFSQLMDTLFKGWLDT